MQLNLYAFLIQNCSILDIWTVSELDLYLKNHSLPWKKKLKKEKLELITTHLKETRAEALRTMTVTGQRLLQEPEAVSDDDDDDDDDEGNNTILGQTRSEESESEEGDESEFEPLAKRPCSTRSGRHASSFILWFRINILLK